MRSYRSDGDKIRWEDQLVLRYGLARICTLYGKLRLTKARHVVFPLAPTPVSLVHSLAARSCLDFIYMLSKLLLKLKLRVSSTSILPHGDSMGVDALKLHAIEKQT